MQVINFHIPAYFVTLTSIAKINLLMDPIWEKKYLMIFIMQLAEILLPYLLSLS